MSWSTAGRDLSKSDPSTTVAKDVLWACVILLPLVAITKYAWLLVLLALAAGGWQAYSTLLAPMLKMGRQVEQPGAATKGRQDKAAKRAERRRVKYK